MEGKGVRAFLVSLFILGFVVEQTKVEAAICCNLGKQQACFNLCLLAPLACAHDCGCLITPYPFCPALNTPQKSDDVINDYCKLGCASSVCNTISTLGNSGGINEYCKLGFEYCKLGFASSICDIISALGNSGGINEYCKFGFEYCKLGFASSICNIISVLGNSDVSEEVKQEHCNNACSEICTTKGSTFVHCVTA